MQAVETDDAPTPLGAYSQGIVDGNRVYVAGQVGIDPATGEVVSDSLVEQTEQTLRNVEAVLEAAGASLARAVKANVYVTDIRTWDEVDAVYADYVPEPYPARAGVEVGNLPYPFQVEMEMTASLD